MTDKGMYLDASGASPVNQYTSTDHTTDERTPPGILSIVVGRAKAHAGKNCAALCLKYTCRDMIMRVCSAYEVNIMLTILKKMRPRTRVPVLMLSASRCDFRKRVPVMTAISSVCM